MDASFTRVVVKIKRLPNFQNLELPSYQTPGSAGMDVRACLPEDRAMIINPGERVAVPTGLAVEVPAGYELQVRPRSGLSLNSNLIMPNAPGTIDSDYRGETKVILYNAGEAAYILAHGDRIAQWVVAPVVHVTLEEVDNLSSTERGAGGFGSTGRQ